MGSPLGIDLDETDEVEFLGVIWTIGTIPFGLFRPLQMRLQAAARPLAQAMSGMDDEQRAAFLKTDEANDLVWSTEYQEAMVPVEQRLLRLGLRSWRTADGSEGDLPPVELESESFDGRSCPAVPWRVVDFFSRVDGGVLLNRLAPEVVRVNTVPSERLTGFR